MSCSGGVDIGEANKVLTSFGLAWPAGFMYSCLSAVPLNVVINALDQNGEVFSWSGTVDILLTNANVTVDSATANISEGTVQLSIVFDTTTLQDEETKVNIRYGDIVTEIDGTLLIEKVLATYLLTVTDDGYGSTQPSGTVEVTHGVPASIAATPATLFGQENWFEQWSMPSGSGVSFENNMAASTTVTLTGGDATVRANFDHSEAVFPSFSATPGNHQVTLEWEPVTLAVSYTLYYTSDGSTPSETNGESVDGVSSPYDLTGLDNGCLYLFKIQAHASEGEADWSGVEQAIPLSPMTLAPAVSSEYMKVVVEWNGIPGTDDFEVLRSTERDGTYTSISGTLQNETSYTDTDVVKGRGYYYKVKPAMTGSVESAPSFAEACPFPANGVKLVSSCGTGSFSHEVAVSGNYAYIADGNAPAGLKVIDISDAESVDDGSLVGSCDTYQAHDVALYGNFAYIADDIEGIKVINISNPLGVDDNSLMGSCDTDAARGITVISGLAFIADANSGLKVADIDNPGNVTSGSIVGSCDTNQAEGVAVSGDYAYVADYTDGLKVIDISDPESVDNSSVVGWCDITSGWASAVAI